MNDTDSTFGVLSAAADNHPTNPAFYEHCNTAMASITAVRDPATQDALRHIFTFLYQGILDLYRKVYFMHRATKDYLRPDVEFDPDQLALLKTIVEYHVEVGGAADSTERMEILERQLHALWQGHKDEWQDDLEEITGVRPPIASGARTIDQSVEERETILGALARQRDADTGNGDHFHDRERLGVLISEKREGDASTDPADARRR